MDKKNKILEAALKLFVEQGFHGTPTSKIAQKAGVATGTLFHHFKTKEALIVSLYIEIKQHMADFISEHTKEEKSLRKIMRGQFAASLHWSSLHQEEFRYIEQFNASPFLFQIAGKEIEKQKKPFFDLLKKGIKNKSIKDMPIDFIHTLIISHIFGLNHYLASNKFSKARQQKIIDNAFDLLWDMLT